MDSPETAAAVLAHALARPALLGGGRLVCIDGPAGSGKTTLAAAVARVAADRGVGTVRVLHTDDLLEGWAGLAALGARLRDDVVEPLGSGGVGRYRRFDWVAGAPAEEHLLASLDLLVLEGVGSGDPGLLPWRATLVWVEAPAEVRLARGLERDGEELRDRWLQWMADEALLFGAHGTRAAADLHVDLLGRLVASSPG